MDLVAEFFRGKTLPRLMMIAALLLCTMSQFFLYFDDPTTGILSIDADWNTVGHYWFGASGTGWGLHPHAYLILVLLAFAFLRDDVAEHRLFRRFGYWVSLLLFFAAITPGAPLRAAGAGLGGVAFLIAFAAAVVHQASGRRARPAAERAPPGR